MLEFAADGQRAAILLISTPDEEIVLTHGRQRAGGPPVAADDQFVLASVSKPYLAAAILRLQERGLLDIDRSVSEYLAPQTAKGFRSLDRVTLHHLLGMRSGLPEYYEDRYFDELIVARRHAVTLERALHYARGKRPLFPPGRDFEYTNTNFLLVQAALEHVTGKPMHQVFDELLFQPVGLAGTAVINAPGSPNLRVAGYEDLFGDGPVDVTRYYHAPGFGDGGLIASAADVARFFRALLIDKSLLSPESLRRMISDPEGDLYGLGIDTEHWDGYGQVYGHSGGDMGFVSNVRVAPAHGIVVVALFASDIGDDLIVDTVLRDLIDGF